MSPGRNALPEIAFSTAGTSTRRRTGSFCDITSRAMPEHVRRAAHVLLHEAHAGRRLDVEAAGVEAHTLADQRDARIASRSPQFRSIRRGAFALARPTAWIVGKFCASRSSPTMTLQLAPNSFASAVAAVGELLRQHVGRRRIDEVSDERGRIELIAQQRGVARFRHQQSRRRALGGFVARVAVCAESPAEHREIGGRVRKRDRAVVAGRQSERQIARRIERIAADHRKNGAAGFDRQPRDRSRIAAMMSGGEPLADALRLFAAPCGVVGGAHDVQRRGIRVRRQSTTRCRQNWPCSERLDRDG